VSDDPVNLFAQQAANRRRSKWLVIWFVMFFLWLGFGADAIQYWMAKSAHPDRPAHFSLTSATVMNMFCVPQLGSMIATMNGMATQLNLKADRPGNYLGQSSQFSGAGFSDMHFVLRALAPDSFTQWTAEARKSRLALDESEYLALARARATSPTLFYGSIDRALFERIAARRLTSEAGPISAPARTME